MPTDPYRTHPNPARGRLREVLLQRLGTHVRRQPSTGSSGERTPPLPTFGGSGLLDGVNLGSNAALLEAMGDEIQAS